MRREAAREIGWFDPAFFVYSDEVDFCKRLRDAGWHTLYVPGARGVHHEQLSTGAVPERRIVELSRNRDRYMRKHHSRRGAALVRWLTAWTYAVRALAAVVLPGHDPRRYWRHVTRDAAPRRRGEGLREAARRLQPRRPPRSDAARATQPARGPRSSPRRTTRVASSASGISAPARAQRGDEAVDAVGRQQQLAGDRQAAGDAHEPREPAPLERRRGTARASAA